MYKFKLTNPTVREMVFKRLFSLGAKTFNTSSWQGRKSLSYPHPRYAICRQF